MKQGDKQVPFLFQAELHLQDQPVTEILRSTFKLIVIKINYKFGFTYRS